jgi:hypothetical protein
MWTSGKPRQVRNGELRPEALQHAAHGFAGWQPLVELVGVDASTGAFLLLSQRRQERVEGRQSWQRGHGASPSALKIPSNRAVLR